MHNDNKKFLFTSMAEMNDGDYAFIGKSKPYMYYFLYKQYGDGFTIKLVNLLDYDELREKARDDFDGHQTRIDEVCNGNTEAGYDDRMNEIDIWDYASQSDYYGANESVCAQLYDLGYWSDPQYDENQDEFLLCERWSLFTPDNVEQLSNILMDEDLNIKLLNDMEKEFGIKEMKFLSCENIR